MNKKLKSSFILLMIAFGIIIAWNTITSYFGGAGVTFVALLGIVATLLIINVNNKEVYDRTKELFISISIFSIIEFVIYFVFEFRLGTFFTRQAFSLIQSLLALFAILFLAYTVFRFTFEIKGKKFDFIETLLGNVKPEKKVKKAKEVSNGSLEEKPNSSSTAIAGQMDVSSLETTNTKEETSTENSEE